MMLKDIHFVAVNSVVTHHCAPNHSKTLRRFVAAGGEETTPEPATLAQPPALTFATDLCPVSRFIKRDADASDPRHKPVPSCPDKCLLRRDFPDT